MDPQKLISGKSANRPPPVSTGFIKSELIDNPASLEPNLPKEDSQTLGIIDGENSPTKRKVQTHNWISLTEEEIQMALELEEEDRQDEETRYKDIDYIQSKIKKIQERQLETTGKKSAVIKSWVSKKKTRFEDSNYNLDLTCNLGSY